MRLENFNYSVSNALLWGNCRAHFEAYKEKHSLDDLFLTAIEGIPVIGQGVSLLEAVYYNLCDDISARHPTPKDKEIGTIAANALDLDSTSEVQSVMTFNEAIDLFVEKNSLASVPREHWEPLHNFLEEALIGRLIHEDRVAKGEVRRCFPPYDMAEAQLIHKVKQVDILKKALNQQRAPKIVSDELIKQFDDKKSLDSIPRDQWNALLAYYKQETIHWALATYLRPHDAIYLIPIYESQAIVLFYAGKVQTINNAIWASQLQS